MGEKQVGAQEWCELYISVLPFARLAHRPRGSILREDGQGDYFYLLIFCMYLGVYGYMGPCVHIINRSLQRNV